VLQKLRKEQSEVNRSTEAGEQTYQKYATQITTAERQLASMTRQQEQAKRAYEMQESGIAGLNKEIQNSIKETDAYVDRLKAEGKEEEALKAQKEGLSRTLDKQSKLYEAQSKELEKLSNSGEASADSISKQKIALDKTATSIAKNKNSLSELDGEQGKLGKNNGAEEAGSKMERFTGKISKSKAGLIAMGASAGAVLAGVAKGVKSIYDAQSRVNEMQATTTLGYKRSKESILAINKLYTAGYGESIDELQEVYTKIEQSHPEFFTKELAENTKLVSTYAKMSGADVQEVLNGADKATRNWNISYQEYFDNMTVLQKMGDDQSGDISDNMAEYSQVLGQMGISISDSMALIDNGVKSGAYNGDKLLDFTKEFQISLNDGRMDEAITSFSKKSQDMFKGYKDGKVTAGDMFKQITSEMGEMTDKQKEATIASNLWSALGEDNSLKVIGSLGKTNWAFKDVKGAAKETADQLKESNPLELLKRSAEASTQSLAMSAGQTEKFKDALKPMQKAINSLLKSAIKAMPGIMKALTPVIDLIANHGKMIVGILSSILAIKFGSKVINSVKGIYTTLKPLMLLMKANPWTIWITAITTVIAGLVALYKHNKTFRDFVNGLAKAVADFAKDFAKWFGKAIDAVVDFVKGIGKWFGEAWKTISDFFKKVIKFIKNDWKELLLLIVNPFAGAFALIYKHNDKFRDNINKLVKNVASFFKGIGKSIGSGVNAITDWFKGLAKGFKKGWDAFLKLAIKIAKGFGRAMIIALAIPVGIAMIITKPLVKPLQNIFNALIKWIKSAWNGLTKFLKAIWTPVQKVWTSAWDAISKFFVTTWKLISKAFKMYLNQVKKNLTTVLGFITKTWNKVWKSISNFFNKVWKAIKKTLSNVLNTIKKTLVSSLNAYIKLWSKAWKSVSKTFSNIWNGIKKFLKPILSWLRNAIDDAMDFVYKIWHKGWNKISSFFSNTWKGMKKFGHDAIWSLKNTFDGVLSKIHDAFSNTWTGIKNGFSDMWQGMKDLARDGINAVIKIPNAGISGINGLIHDFGGPKHAISKIPSVKKFATGTGMFSNVRKAITKPTLALLNDGNDSPETGNQETLIHPNGAMELVQGRNTKRILAPGTEVLNASETAMMLGMKAMPFKSGTGFWSGVFGGVTKVAGNVWNGMKNGVKKFTEMFKFITNAVAHPVKTLQDKFNPSAKGLAGMFDSFGTAMFKKPKSQAKNWWKTLWSMANDASAVGASAGNLGDDYQFKNKAKDEGMPSGDPWGYFFRECVSFVASRLSNLGVSASKFSFLGNGRDWVNARVPHSSKPKPGDVAVYAAGSAYGNHVSMVNGVQGDTISGEEYNFNNNGKYHQYSGRPASGATTFLDFGVRPKSKDGDSVKANSGLEKLIKKQTGGMLKWIQKFIAPLNEDGTGGSGQQAPAGTGVRRWRSQVEDALRANGLSTSDSMINKILTQISTESGGNPRASQHGDPDGDGSGPAMGLMQVKRDTFNANAFKGHKNIWNGYDSLLAGLNYAKKRYGSSLSWLGHGQGYERGGLVSTHGLYEIAEKNKPEMIIPLAGDNVRANQLLDEASLRINGKKNNTIEPVKTDVSKLEKKLDNMIELLSKLVSGQGNQVVQAVIDKNELYKTQANDANIRGYQSLI
jgi:SLT domain-containing protein/phage-related protein